jgi:hypothetical protein
MKKALIAAAVAGAFAAPSAMAAELQINLDWGQALQFGEVTTTTAAGVDSTIDTSNVADAGRNRLKFNFTETLDNGVDVHAYMVFNTSTSADGGGGGNAAIRNANIGFSGDFGTVNVGTNEHFFETDLIIDPLAADYNATADPILHIGVGSTGFQFVRRDGESIWYSSKDMNGIQFRAAYIMGPQTATADADQDGTQVGLSYRSGPLFVGVNQATYNDYDQGSNNGTIGTAAAVAGTEAKATSLKVSYDFGAFSVTGAMADIEQSGISQAVTGGTATAISVDMKALNVTMPVSGGKVWFGIAENGNQDANIAGVTSAIVDSGKDSWDVGYLHDMSAQTYVFVRYGSSETGLNFDTTAGSTETTDLLFGWCLTY